MIVKERDSYFDNLKGFLIISVIIGNSLELANPEKVNIHFFVLLLYVFHMPLFAFVSGYFSKLSKRTTKEKVIDTVKLYVYAQVFYTAFNYLLLWRHGTKLQMLMPQWTLWYLLSMVFWYIISDYVKDYKKWIIGTIIVAMLAGLDGSIGTNGSFARTVFFLPFFIGGMAFKIEYLEVLRKHKIKVLIGSLASIVALYFLNEATPIELFFEYTKYTWYFEKPWFPMFMRAFHYLSAILVGMSIFTFMPSKKTKLSKVGKYSLIMYLTHSGVSEILITSKVLKYNSTLQAIISTIIVVAVVIIVTFSYVKFKENKRFKDIKKLEENEIIRDKKIS